MGLPPRYKRKKFQVLGFFLSNFHFLQFQPQNTDEEKEENFFIFQLIIFHFLSSGKIVAMDGNLFCGEKKIRTFFIQFEEILFAS